MEFNATTTRKNYMISTVITYCSLDHRFINTLIDQVKKFSNDIVLVCFDHLLNGKPDDISNVLDIPGVKTIVLPFDIAASSRYLHSLSRWEGANNTSEEWILFLDADEILDGDKFKEFVDTNAPFNFDFSTFNCYWYFRDPTYQATTEEQTGLLMRRNKLDKAVHFAPGERWAYMWRPNVNIGINITTPTGPMLHHYSWVRTKDEMLEKVKGWGHKDDRDWVTPIIEEFSREFNGTDFVHGYSYKKVDNQFDIQIPPSN